MWLLWDWMGLDHWEFHGMVLWVMQWDSMDLHWVLLIGNSILSALWVCHWDAQMELPWNCIGTAP